MSVGKLRYFVFTSPSGLDIDLGKLKKIEAIYQSELLVFQEGIFNGFSSLSNKFLSSFQPRTGIRFSLSSYKKIENKFKYIPLLIT